MASRRSSGPVEPRSECGADARQGYSKVMERGTRVTVVGLSIKPQYNGRIGTVRGLSEKRGAAGQKCSPSGRRTAPHLLAL